MMLVKGRAVYHPSCSLARKLGGEGRTTYAAENAWTGAVDLC